MVELLRIRGRDFCQLREFDVPLFNLGLVWVGGDNQDTASASSNGAGKTNFLKAIGWAIFGKMPEKEAADDVIREGEKTCNVELFMSDGWVLTRSRRKGVEKVVLEQNDKPFVGDKEDVQRKMTELIGLDWRAFLTTRYYTKGFSKRFIHPDTSDADRKAVFHRISGTEIVSAAHEKVGKKIKGLKKEATAIEEEVNGLSVRLRAMNTKAIKEARDEWADHRNKRLAACRKEIADIEEALTLRKCDAASLAMVKGRIENAEKRLQRARERETKIGELEAEFAQLHLDLRVLQNETTNKAKEAARFDADVKKAGSGECSVCGSTVGESSKSRQHLASLRNAAGQARKKIEELQRESAVKSEKKRTVASELAELKSLQPVDDAREELEGLREQEREHTLIEERLADARRDLEKEKEREKTIVEDLNPYIGQLKILKDERASVEGQIEELEEDLQKKRRTLAHWEFWKAGFGPSGLPSYLFDSMMPGLTDRTNEHLEVLTDRDITMRFDTQKANRSNASEIRDKISITWEIEGVAGKQPSGGQWRKMEIASDLGLMDVAAGAAGGKGVSLVILDEVLDGLDSVGRDRLVLLLKRLRKSRGTIFVVSHDPEMSEAFEKSIVVVKKGGSSTVRVAL